MFICAKKLTSIGAGDGGQGRHVPPKIRGKYFSGNFCVKFGHFRAKIVENSGILLIYIFLAKMSCPLKFG